MKDLLKMFATLPAHMVGILLIGFGMLFSSTIALANEADSELVLESWMTVPFDNTMQESEINLEIWMAIPFDNEELEPDMYLESWMVNPFTYENGD